LIKLIIAEKPSVAKTIANAIGNPVFNKDYYEAGGWTISFALGHIVNLVYPEEYNPAFKKWSVDSLPIIPSEFKYTILNKQRFYALSKLIQQADVIVNACDAGREGELIFREIIMLAQPKKTAKIYRLWISALTKEEIQKELNNLKDINKYDNLYFSAEARAKADWLVGINATRAFTIKANELHTIGRVQTPTLYAIVKREEERAKTQDKKYYEIVGTFHSDEYNGVLQTADILEDKSIAESVVQGIQVGTQGVVQNYQDRVVQVSPPLLYDLTTLQREANSEYHYTAQQTLDIAQALYEKGVISYPRTDSRYLPSSLKATVENTVKQIYQGPIGPIYSGVINDAGVSDHYALIPTGKPLTTSDVREQKIYDLIEKRFIAEFLGFAHVQKQNFETVLKNKNKNLFKTEREALLDPGWRAIYGDKPVNRLPDISKTEHILVELNIAERIKKKPSSFTDASLLHWMEKVGKTGLGTPATRAQIIERLVETKYVARVNNFLVPTQKGINLVKKLEALKMNELLSPDLTAYFEEQLKEIEEGKKREDDFISDMENYTKNVTSKLLEASLV